MLGIFLIICLVVFWITKSKAYILLRNIHNKTLEIDNINDIRLRSIRLHIISGITALIGYIGCFWPYLFIEGISKNHYIIGIVAFGIVPVLFIAYACYLDIKWTKGSFYAGIFPLNFWLMMASLPLFYTSYCCIDYDFFKKDYIAEFNTLGADSNQTENAWPYYMEAIKHYTKLEDNLQKPLRTGLKSDCLSLNDNDRDKLRKWFEENASSWANLQKAAFINYCNTVYKDISFPECKEPNDFVKQTLSFWGSINNFYGNITAGQFAGVFDFDWLDLLQMELITSKQFIHGKTFTEQLLGCSMLNIGTKLLANQDKYTEKDLQKAKKMLKSCFPSGLPELNIEGEVLLFCIACDKDIQSLKFPVVTPLNRTFIQFGSISGFETYVRKQYKAMLEAADRGVKFKPKGFSIITFPTQRREIFSDAGNTYKATAKVYKIFQRAKACLSAAYVLLDLEEYKLINGRYPDDVSQLGQVGLNSQLPDDPDTKGKIIYRNDGHRAILYSVGSNAKDDGGYKDDKDCDKKRDDIIYWQRNLREKETSGT